MAHQLANTILMVEHDCGDATLWGAPELQGWRDWSELSEE